MRLIPSTVTLHTIVWVVSVPATWCTVFFCDCILATQRSLFNKFKRKTKSKCVLEWTRWEKHTEKHAYLSSLLIVCINITHTCMSFVRGNSWQTTIKQPFLPRKLYDDQFSVGLTLCIVLYTMVYRLPVVSPRPNKQIGSDWEKKETQTRMCNLYRMKWDARITKRSVLCYF